jgi:cellulose synthase/poly-beta-1,6-N-acetylglucosamine synthase-like glycosyltransferase
MSLLLVICFVLILLGPCYLFWLSLRKRSLLPPASSFADLPFVDVLVPLKDECSFVKQKLENLKSLDYPADRICFWLIDGGSSDGTIQLIQDFVHDNEKFHLLVFDISSKTAQLNHAIPFCKGSWILVTDADALLLASTLKAMLNHCEERENVAVVGAQVEPDQAMSLERSHWKFSNWLRTQESSLGYASFVTAPCYLFRRDLLERFPEDVISDDIHIALLAMSRGQAVSVIPLTVTELRSPTTFWQLFYHKWRKSRAYFREIFRFLPFVTVMPSLGRSLFLWRAAQMILIPQLCLIALLVTAQTFSFLALLLIAISASIVVFIKTRSLLSVTNCFILSLLWTIVLFIALVSLPLSKQTASYRRIGVAPFRARN